MWLTKPPSPFSKLRGFFEWKDIFTLDSLGLLRRALRSVRYGVNSRIEFDSDLSEFYVELNSLRGAHSEEFTEYLRRSKISLINAHSFAAVVVNERWQLQWKLNEAMSESAPQLLLQLVIAFMQVGYGETVGPMTIIGILISLASFSWTLHLVHYRYHYDGFKNNFKLKTRVADFLAHFLIVGCRFIALSIVMALSPLWFSVAAFFYFGFLSLYLFYCSSDRGEYRKLTTHTINTLWMVYRLLITPYDWDIWRINRYDDLFYHLETFALALSWPFLLDGGHPLADYRWIITAIILTVNFIVLPLLLKFNETMLEKAPHCKDHDPFFLRWRIQYDLKAGKTREERLFGRSTSTSTSSYKYRVECPIVGIPPVVGTL